MKGSVTKTRRLPALVAAIAGFFTLQPAASFGQGAGTHLDVVPGRIVQLAMRSGKSTVCPQQQRDPYELVRVKSSGALSNDSFIVPRDKVFIVTDVIWAALPRVRDSFSAGQSLEPRLLSYRSGDPNTQTLTYQLPPLLIPSNADNAILGDHVGLTAGVVIAGGRGLCLDVRRVTPAGFSNEWVNDVRIIGYIAILP